MKDEGVMVKKVIDLKRSTDKLSYRGASERNIEKLV